MIYLFGLCETSCNNWFTLFNRAFYRLPFLIKYTTPGTFFYANKIIIMLCSLIATLRTYHYASYLILLFLCHRGRTAGYPTAPSQIPACGFSAPGSSVLLASYKSVVQFQYPMIRGFGILK